MCDVDAELRRGQRRDRVGLHHVADAERGEHGEEREEHAEPLHAEAALERVHRPAQHGAVLGRDAVLHGQQRLAVLRGHAEDAGQPHPQHRAGAAQADRGRDADDVAGADGGGKRGRQRGERADVAAAPFSAVTDSRIAVSRCRCMNAVRMVRKMWVPKSRMRRGGPQTKASAALIQPCRVSIMPAEDIS